MDQMDCQLRIVVAYLHAKDAALKHWLGALELAQALSGKPDVGQSYQALQEQKQRVKHEQVHTQKGLTQGSPPKKFQKPQIQEYDIDEDESD